MSELPPEIAVEPEPTDGDPPPDAIRPDRPRIWPEEARPPRPQIKRPMEEWLAEFVERVKQVDARPREQPSRRRRPRGLARIVPVAARPERPQEAAGTEAGRPQAPDQQRRGRRRRRGGGAGDRAVSGGPSAPVQSQGQGKPPRRALQRPPGAPGGQRGRDRRPNPPRDGSPRPGPPPTGEGNLRPPPSGDTRDPNRRRRRRGRGRGRGPRPNGPPPAGGNPPSGGPSPG